MPLNCVESKPEYCGSDPMETLPEMFEALNGTCPTAPFFQDCRQFSNSQSYFSWSRSLRGILLSPTLLNMSIHALDKGGFKELRLPQVTLQSRIQVNQCPQMGVGVHKYILINLYWLGYKEKIKN